MMRRSWLDGALERFQHRWETNPQYRATMSGVLGIVFLVVLCACVGLVSISTQSALAAMGFAGGGNNNSADQSSAYTGSKAAHGVTSIPVATVGLGTPQAIPDATLPASGTPLPTPTLAPTPTDTPTPPPCNGNCGNGGGGGSCSGCVVSDSVTDPLVPGQNATVTVHTSQPNIPINIIADVPGCVTQLNLANTYTNGAGDGAWTFPVCGGASSGQRATITVSAGFNNGATQVYGPTLHPKVA